MCDLLCSLTPQISAIATNGTNGSVAPNDANDSTEAEKNHKNPKIQKSLMSRINDIKALAREQGLDFFETNFEVVPIEMMTKVATYALPIRAGHFTYGAVHKSQRIFGDMGMSKIYEIVLNNDPSLAFLLDTNRDIDNLLVAAHVYGHTDFFKNNIMFAPTDRNMINNAALHKRRIDEYKYSYGRKAVEHVMSIGFALDKHINANPKFGVHRKLYPERKIVKKERYVDEYADLSGEDQGLSIYYVEENAKLPPYKEKDLLWFIINYGGIKDEWVRDVLGIIREESYYFYPQFLTKIMNEGWASYWHAEIFAQLSPSEITPEEMIEFAKLNSSVVNPGGRTINPYYLGYTIWVDIEKRWNEKHAQDHTQPTGREKMFEVRRTDDDCSFLRNYLTTELVERLNLYAVGPEPKEHPQPPKPGDKIIITSREREEVVQSLLRLRMNYGVPEIVVSEINKGDLFLEHIGKEEHYLDRKFALETLKYIQELWPGNNVILWTNDTNGKEEHLANVQ